ncbi:hypothetical protein EST38_g5316 [Candolleomyces aberdarensis]|uniref:Uncharacterized protein n=1 Tax=Candolleomyces aberdarensis TaxID=2316362 RepID=A0A4Q2DKU1_9AGAR|nr:hypothetical protein EST38_g5316 [Candolleomyces aberdarensis]
MSRETDFEALRTKLRAHCAYLADPDILKQLEWFETQDFDHVVLKEDVDRFIEDGAPRNNPPQPARLAGIFRLSHRHHFFMRACSSWRPNPFSVDRPFAEIRPSAFTEDPGIPELEGDYSMGWENLAELSREWYRSRNLDEARVTESHGAIDWKKPRPSPAEGFKIGRRVFEKRTPESLGRFQDHGPRFRIENWPVEFPEAQAELNKIKSTHIAHPIPAYYPAPENNLIPPDRYWDDLRGAIVRLEFHLNHWFIRGRHVFTADIVRMKVLVPPKLPPSSPVRLGGTPIGDDFPGESRRSARQQAASSSTYANVPHPNAQAGPSNRTDATRGTKKNPVKTESVKRQVASSNTYANVPQPTSQAGPSNRTDATRGTKKTPVKTESAKRQAASSSTNTNVPHDQPNRYPQASPCPLNNTNATRGAKKTPVRTESEEETPTTSKGLRRWFRKGC